MSSIAQEAMIYASYGWHVVPLYPNSKKPALGYGWQNKSSSDEDVISQWFTEEYPDANVGIVFGKRSGIIDIECDSPEAEEQFQELFGAHEIITPTFKSRRGKHRFFKYTDEMPWTHKAKHEQGHIEFRIGGGDFGAQSVAPPSEVDGVLREWIVHPSECSVAEIPEDVLAVLWTLQADIQQTAEEGKPDEHWETVLSEDIREGGRNDRATEITGRLLREQKQMSKGVPWGVLQSWNQNHCKPPLPLTELRTTFGSIWQKESERRQAETVEKLKEQSNIPESFQEMQETAGQWRITRVQSDPPLYELESPIWPDEKVVGLTDEDIHIKPAGIIIKASQQLQAALNKNTFPRDWLGFKKRKGGYQEGILQKIWPHMGTREATPEMRRDMEISEAAVEWLREIARDMKDPQSSGRPSRLEDGSIWFKASVLFKELQDRLPEKPKRGEMSAFYDRHDIATKQKRVDGRPIRFKVITESQRVAIDNWINQPVEPKQPEFAETVPPFEV